MKLTDFNIYLANLRIYLCSKFQFDRTINTEVMQVSLALQCCLRLQLCCSFYKRAYTSVLHLENQWTAENFAFRYS